MKEEYKEVTSDELIGTEYVCPWNGCKDKIPVTKDGIKHYGKRHWVIQSLEEYADMYNWGRKREYDFWHKILNKNGRI